MDDSGMEVQIAYSGKGFEYHRMENKNPITIPGELKNVTVDVNMSNPGAGAKLTLLDAYGEWQNIDFPKFESESWQTVTIPVPENIPQPVSIHSFMFHNWGTRTEKTDVVVGLRRLNVETDLSRADPQTGRFLDWKADPSGKDKKTEAPDTPLFSASFSSTAPGHFFAGTDAELILNIHNWREQPAQVKATVTVTDPSGKSIFTKTIKHTVEATEQFTWSPPLESYGPHRAEVVIENEGYEPAEAYLIFAEAPKPHDLTEAEKLASPYGMNVHGAQGLFITPFRNAGIVWFRDYVFNFHWLERAKKNNRNFSGWPGYPGIVQTYKDEGAMVLPVLAHSIPRPKIVDGEVQGNPPPDRAWVAHLAEVLEGFPQYTYWELDNEYSLDKDARNAEKKMNWAHYESYHKKFGEAVKLLGFGELKAVENGRYGIHPDLALQAVQNGSFNDIDVVNVHHYAGVDAPEINVRNFNTGSLGRESGLFFDKLRDVVAAAHSDGRDREVFISEFGWDTAAGQVVTEEQQAAYLARAYMMFAAAGIDKSFWFWHFDSPEPKLFFDACGLMTANREPKPSLCAMAGMTHLLPSLNFIGSFNAGPGTLGYVFEENGQYIAAAWRIAKGDDPIEIDFGKGVALYDHYANPLPGSKAKLGISPTYAVGLSKDSDILQRAAYSIDSHLFMATVANEKTEIVVRIDNQSDKNNAVILKPNLPSGWKSDKAEYSVKSASGQNQTVTIPFKTPTEAQGGIEPLSIDVLENGKLLTKLYLEAHVLEPYILTVGGMPNNAGPVEVTTTVTNQRNIAQSPTLKLELPESWRAITKEVVVENLQPLEERDVTLKFEWNADVELSNPPLVVLEDTGFKTEKPLIPPMLTIHRLPGNGWFDGQVSQWPAQNKLPEWMVGSSYGEAQADIWLGWTDQGIWIGLNVEDSKALGASPRTFWQTDTLELFIDADNDKLASSFSSGDHQFWAVPQTDINRVFLGQWKRANEIEETRYDITLPQSSALKTDTGYTMEFLIPWDEVQGSSSPTIGQQFGLNFNLSVKGPHGPREVYWPRVKANGLANQPKQWGAIELNQ
ncbi:sugar-binding protein [Cerasicoccus frondis]|uniref:sugar-binding protein n=1 Tax=Cerasicoccus frondis TaxID=490090 RepID=UPI002852A82B|nr:sugar-binding protein [Cerasicoccus frondis]